MPYHYHGTPRCLVESRPAVTSGDGVAAGGGAVLAPGDRHDRKFLGALVTPECERGDAGTAEVAEHGHFPGFSLIVGRQPPGR